MLIINLNCNCKIELMLLSKSAKLHSAKTCEEAHDANLLSNISSIIAAPSEEDVIADFEDSMSEELTGLETFH